MNREQIEIAEAQDRHDEIVAELLRADDIIRDVLAEGVSDPEIADRVFEAVAEVSRLRGALRGTQGQLARLSARIEAEDDSDV